MFQSRVIRFDELLVPRTGLDDLDEVLSRRFLRHGTVPDRNDLRKLRVADADESGVWRLTVAGVLMCTRNPHDWLPHAQIQAVRYVGERYDANYQLDAQDIGGPLDEQVSQALRFVVRNMSVMATKEVYRLERSQYSDRAVFEALVNAVAHRDYSISGSRVRLHMFADRIELYVPGALANTLTPDSMHLRQYNRNELIVSLLSRCTVPVGNGGGQWRMMERRGDGVPIILEESSRLSGRYPQYEVIDDSELRLVIWAATPDWSDG